MNLYRISQAVNVAHDTFDSAVVAAESFNEAARIHPDGRADGWQEQLSRYDSWTSPEHVTVTLIGVASAGVNKGVILASFNAG